MESYELLDTSAFDQLISSRSQLENRYQEIRNRYERIVKNLMEQWKGRGAEAFERDTEKVVVNISGLQDILATMCDTLQDCRSVFGECDTSLGNMNRNSG